MSELKEFFLRYAEGKLGRPLSKSEADRVGECGTRNEVMRLLPTFSAKKSSKKTIGKADKDVDAVVEKVVKVNEE